MRKLVLFAVLAVGVMVPVSVSSAGPGTLDTTITSGPDPLTRSHRAVFTYTSDPVGAGFECRLDSTNDADWAPCNGGKPYVNVADGHHTFEVRANDNSGTGPDLTPASFTWVVDSIPPTVTFTQKPPHHLTVSGAQGRVKVKFFWDTNDPKATFSCRVDDGKGHDCTSPRKLGLRAGSHTFSVTATDKAGNVSRATYDLAVAKKV